jgi:HAD superfamily hydrolase (TIGR01509 family)
MPPLRALLVDVGGTLIDDATWLASDRSNRLRRERLAAALGPDQPWFDDFLDATFEGGEASAYEQRTADRVLSFLLERGMQPTPGLVEAICRASAPPMHEVAKVEDHAREAMEAAHGLGLRLAICSNTLWRNDEDSRRDWQELGFGHLFDAYVTSHSTGWEKPHPAIFERCLAALEVRPEEAAMLGDRPERDVLGARELGMRAVWKRPPNFVGQPDPEPDAELTCLRDLRSILERWVGHG